MDAKMVCPSVRIGARCPRVPVLNRAPFLTASSQMTLFQKRSLIPVLLIFLVGGLVGAQLQSYLSSDDALTQFQKMKQAFVLVSAKYMDRVEPEVLASGGVQGIVDRLDPHSSYIPPNRAPRVRSKYEGSFGGIGITYNILDDTARVISPVSGGPSESAGVMAGDRIVTVEDSTAVGASDRELRDRLRGRIGSEVTFTVYRPLSNKRLTFTIERGEIPLYSVHSAYMIDARTGYIDIGRFSRSTHREFMKDVNRLKRQGMERLLLDLRQNHGGVMKAAIRIADEMLGTGGQTIVKTDGRVSSLNRAWNAQNGGALTNQPITVLVDDQTASASEILAGALQDHDRALLVGRRTFGKALVQKPFHLKDGSLLNLAVGRYYTPVGRLIQTPYERGDRGNYERRKLSNIRDAVYNVQTYKSQIPDSLTYRTDHGRTVFGGGGILPDYVVKPDTATLSGFLERTSADPVFKYYAHEWVSDHEQRLRSTWRNRSDEFVSSYAVPEAAISGFWAHVRRDDILRLTSDTEEAAPNRRVYPKSQMESAEDVVRTHLKGHIANVLYGNSTGTPVLHQTDPTIQKALSLWPSSQELASYHSPGTETARDRKN